MDFVFYHNENFFVEETVRPTRAILLVNDTRKFCTAIFGYFIIGSLLVGLKNIFLLPMCLTPFLSIIKLSSDSIPKLNEWLSVEQFFHNHSYYVHRRTVAFPPKKLKLSEDQPC